MAIPSTLNLTAEVTRKLNSGQGGSPNNINAALQKTIRDVAREALDSTRQQVKRVEIVDTGAEAAEIVVKRHRESDQVLIDEQMSLRSLQTTSAVQYLLVLQELCPGRCGGQVDSTTMYVDVTSHLNTAFSNGGFTSSLRTNSMACGSTCDGVVVSGGTFGPADILVAQSPSPTGVPTEGPSKKPSTRKPVEPPIVQVGTQRPTNSKSKKEKGGKSTKKITGSYANFEEENSNGTIGINRYRAHVSKDQMRS